MIKGFGYDFNALRDGDKDPLAKAFAKIFDSDEEMTTTKLLEVAAWWTFGIVRRFIFLEFFLIQSTAHQIWLSHGQ